MSDKVVNIETLLINRRREKNCKCLMPKYEIDIQNHLVYCQNCMAVVEPFEALKDYAKANSSELKILDEQKVKEIIKIGIMAYHAEELKNYSHSYIKKSKIEDIIIALNDGRNISKLVDYMKSNDLVMPEVIQKILQQLLEEN